MNGTVQMNVRISKDLKDFAMKDAKIKFQSLSKYVERLIYMEKERSKELSNGRRADMN